ncbi:MAG TPA: sigma-70 family RNA polymerase sigma factor [Polyangiaceae bacterium]|nr:sigma-70 family RNA polymerase sigma factor [Polyangiaceae bacterium]
MTAPTFHSRRSPGAPARALPRLSEQRSFVTRLMRRFGVPSADVEDAAQEVLLISHRREKEVDANDDRRAWLYQTARYVSYNRLRALRREARRRSFAPLDLDAQRAGTSCAPDDWAASRQLCALLTSALEQLRQEQRSVLLASLLEEHSVAEIALEQAAPVATVAARLQVGRRALRRHLHRRGWPVQPAAAGARSPEVG